ncbi:hypothetical protein E2C01_045596 [Portunus trituberculatus]|uniref:Uncharacterized protein n=1 Tax=Portunus trituberculatus TaxID=210409 RepID=A0A5B7G3E9_PORTR|nr:hypothetical protein [Portunus trituberculatus]
MPNIHPSSTLHTHTAATSPHLGHHTPHFTMNTAKGKEKSTNKSRGKHLSITTTTTTNTTRTPTNTITTTKTKQGISAAKKKTI